MSHQNAPVLKPADTAIASSAQVVKQPKLEIKKDAKGMVMVPGAMVVEVTSARQLWAAIEAGQKNRHVAATQVRAPACSGITSCAGHLLKPLRALLRW